MVWLPLVTRKGSNSSEEDTTNEGVVNPSSGDGKLLRSLGIVLGIGALAYLLARWRREESPLEDRQIGTLGESGDDGELENARRIPIGGSSSESDQSNGDDEGTGTGESGTSDDEIGGTVSKTDRSDAEIDERAEPDVQEEPAEPGEMTIDEDVADELVDENGDESDDDESAENV